MRAKDHRAGRRGVLVCSLLATLPECFANKHTHALLQRHLMSDSSYSSTLTVALERLP